MSYTRKKQLKLPQDGQRWLDLKAAAAYESASVSSVRRQIHRGELRAITMLGHLVVDRQDIDDLMLRNKRILPPYRQGSRPHIAERHAKARAKKAA